MMTLSEVLDEGTTIWLTLRRSDAASLPDVGNALWDALAAEISDLLLVHVQRNGEVTISGESVDDDPIFPSGGDDVFAGLTEAIKTGHADEYVDHGDVAVACDFGLQEVRCLLS